MRQTLEEQRTQRKIRGEQFKVTNNATLIRLIANKRKDPTITFGRYSETPDNVNARLTGLSKIINKHSGNAQAKLSEEERNILLGYKEQLDNEKK